MTDHATERQLAVLEYTNRDIGFSHTQYDEETLQYEYLKHGNPEAVNAARVYFAQSERVKFTDDALVNMRYMFVVAATLATRFAIEGGMNSEVAYNISDIFIRRMHESGTLDEIREVHAEMIGYFTSKMGSISREAHYPKPVMLAIEHIYQHLHERIRMSDLCDAAALSPSYLSVLFKRETGLSVTDFITRARVETAQRMLLFSDYTLAEIAEMLAFSSQSYFSEVFKRETGSTPSQYRKDNYLRSLKGKV